MNIYEQTYTQFQELYEAQPASNVDLFFAQNFMGFVELLEPYANQGASLNILTRYLLIRDAEMYDVFIHCLLNLGIRANA